MTQPRHESSDVTIRPVAVFIAVLFGSVVAVMALMAWLYGFFSRHQPQPVIVPSPLVSARQTPPEPRLQAVPALDLRALRAAEARALSTYGWVDPKAGVVRIPIDRAMDLLAEREAGRR